MKTISAVSAAFKNKSMNTVLEPNQRVVLDTVVLNRRDIMLLELENKDTTANGKKYHTYSIGNFGTLNVFKKSAMKRLKNNEVAELTLEAISIPNKNYDKSKADEPRFAPSKMVFEYVSLITNDQQEQLQRAELREYAFNIDNIVADPTATSAIMATLSGMSLPAKKKKVVTMKPVAEPVTEASGQE